MSLWKGGWGGQEKASKARTLCVKKSICESSLTQERFSNVSDNRFFSGTEITGKTLSARKNIIGNITLALSQISRLNLDKFGVGNYFPDC